MVCHKSYDYYNIYYDKTRELQIENYWGAYKERLYYLLLKYF